MTNIILSHASISAASPTFPEYSFAFFVKPSSSHTQQSIGRTPNKKTLKSFEDFEKSRNISTYSDIKLLLQALNKQ